MSGVRKGLKSTLKAHYKQPTDRDFLDMMVGEVSKHFDNWDYKFELD